MRWVLAIVLASASLASAQDSDLMSRAREAADAGRLIEARDLLVQLMDDDPSPKAAANLAMVRRSLGELLESQRLLERLVAGELGELDAERQAEATELLREVRSEVGTLTVVVRGASGPVPIRLDGHLVGETSADGRLTIACDPGRHLVRAIAAGRTLEEEVEVGIGGASTIELGFEAPAVTPEAVANDPVNQSIVDDRGASRSGNGVAIGVAIGASLIAIIVVVAVIVFTVGSGLPEQPDGFLGSSRL